MSGLEKSICQSSISRIIDITYSHEAQSEVSEVCSSKHLEVMEIGKIP